VSSLARCAIKQPDGTDGHDRTPDLGQSVLMDELADGSDDSPISFDVLNDEIAGTYEAAVGGTPIGGVPYNLVGRDRIALLAVSVLPEFRGRGVSTELIRRVLDDARALGNTVTHYCPVVHKFIENNSGYADLIDTGHPRAVAGPQP
jgi:predicted GNAT family acetyltransferase